MALSSAAFVVIFAALVLVEKPGLGTGHFFYLPIALLGVAFGPRWGAAAGLLSATLYTIAFVLNDKLPTSDLLTFSTPIRTLTYTLCGALVGWFAARNRELILQLAVLAERDRLTGLPNARAFEAAVDRRFDRKEPFALLLGDLDGLRRRNEDDGYGDGDALLVRLAETLGRLLKPGEEIARVGGDEFAILASVRTKDEAAARANLLERWLAQDGLEVTFGWAAYPGEGTNALGLVRVADERLYARKLVTGRRAVPPQQPKLITG